MGLFMASIMQVKSAETSDPEAVKLLSSLLSEVKTMAIKTDFKLIMTVKGNPNPQYVNGVFTLKGSKFVLDMFQLKTYYNGVTQWSYVSQNNEVSITTPSEKDLSETNPMAILMAYSTKSLVSFSTAIKSPKNYCIEMIPNAKEKDLQKILVQINKTTNNPVSIKIFYKNGNVNMLSLTNFQRDVKVDDGFFVFIPSKIKGIHINDLR